MRALGVLALASALGSVGCASTMEGMSTSERDFSGFARRASPSIRVGDARIVKERIRPTLPIGNAGPARVEVGGGRFIVFWTRGSMLEGRRALAQAFNADGSPRGAPAVISPPDVDVVGAPSASTTDGQHVIATFVAASEDSFNLLAVPVETATPGAEGERAARR